MSTISVIKNDLEKAVFKYLFDLQKSGQTNMFGASAYILKRQEFAALDIDKANVLVQKWMTNYRAIKAELSATNAVSTL